MYFFEAGMWVSSGACLANFVWWTILSMLQCLAVLQDISRLAHRVVVAAAEEGTSLCFLKK